MIQRNKTNSVVKSALEATKGLDIFPKIEEDYVETSSTRGTISIIIYISIGFLVISEIKYFYETQPHYSYEVDFDYVSKLKLSIDMTVATECESISGDVLDSTSNLLSHESLNMTDTWFELSGIQQSQFEAISSRNNHIRSNYHALHAALWLEKDELNLGKREIIPNYQKDACRIHGTLSLNKVLGLFHVLTGKPVNIMGQHGHALKMFQNGAANFSHRIDNFSFGDNTNLVHNALNYEFKVDKTKRTIYQYFVSVVATQVKDKKTFQYSVTERESQADHTEGNHGQPGIYFKYDISPIKVKVNIDKKPWRDLIISLIGLVGGIFATSNMFNSLFQAGKEYIKNK